ncbi:DUF6850 family outer membrane beta-barrel protein [Niabella sp. 22666]|uniref:DUF6850 family outer membrane beta-barrel protein n=1 Tax=Niabella sp. 22666 TaxID=3453954 RepID=UPI003F8622F3
MRTFLPVNFNRLAIGYKGAKGKFIPGQGSTANSDIFLDTEGKAILKDIQLWGRFSYQRINEDSTRFAHQTRNNPSTPFYLGSPAYNSYNRTIYNLQGQMERQMLRDNLPLVAGVDYRVGNHFASNDPRGEINDFNLDLRAGLGYHISKKLFAGLTYKYGYGRENVAVAYKNSTYYESTVYPEYNTYTINGYGEPLPTLKLANMKYQNDRSRSGLEATLMYHFSGDHVFVLTGSAVKEDQEALFRGTNSDTIFNRYYLDMKKISALWKLREGGTSWSILADYSTTEGNDRNYKYNGLNNYLYNATNAKLKLALSKTGRNFFIWNYTLGMERKKQERMDGLYGNHVAYTNYQFQFSTGVVKNKDTHVWGISLMPIFGFSPSSFDILKIAASSNGYFTRRVIYHDYLYHTSSFAAGRLSGSYNIKVGRSMHAGLSGYIGFTKQTQFREIQLESDAYPGADRWDSGISITFTF